MTTNTELLKTCKDINTRIESTYKESSLSEIAIELLDVCKFQEFNKFFCNNRTEFIKSLNNKTYKSYYNSLARIEKYFSKIFYDTTYHPELYNSHVSFCEGYFHFIKETGLEIEIENESIPIQIRKELKNALKGSNDKNFMDMLHRTESFYRLSTLNVIGEKFPYTEIRDLRMRLIKNMLKNVVTHLIEYIPNINSFIYTKDNYNEFWNKMTKEQQTLINFIADDNLNYKQIAEKLNVTEATIKYRAGEISKILNKYYTEGSKNLRTNLINFKHKSN